MTGIYRSGQRKLVKFAVASATVIARNDICALQSTDDDIIGAGDAVWDTDLATTQATFANRFAGIAYEDSANLKTDDVSVDISSDAIYEFTCNSAAYEMGDSLGPDKAGGDALLDQTLEAAVASSSICRAQRNEDSAVTLLKVTFASAFNPSANNVNAVVG